MDYQIDDSIIKPEKEETIQESPIQTPYNEEIEEKEIDNNKLKPQSIKKSLITIKKPSFIPPFYLKMQADLFLKKESNIEKTEDYIPDKQKAVIDKLEGLETNKKGKNQYIDQLEKKLFKNREFFDSNEMHFLDDEYKREIHNIEQSNTKHMPLELISNDFFATNSYRIQKYTNQPIALLTISLDKLEIVNWCQFTSENNLMNLLEEKIKQYKIESVNSKIALYRKTSQVAAREAAIATMQDSVDYIRDIWNQLKAISYSSNEKEEKEAEDIIKEEAVDLDNEEINKDKKETIVIMDEREVSNHLKTKLDKKLVVKRYTNLDGLEDFYIDLESTDNETSQQDKENRFISKQKVFVKIFIDNKLVHKTKSFRIQKIVEILQDIKVFIVKSVSTLRIEIHKKGFFFKSIIDKKEIDLQDIMLYKSDEFTEVYDFISTKGKEKVEEDSVLISHIWAKMPFRLQIRHQGKKIPNKDGNEKITEYHKLYFDYTNKENKQINKDKAEKNKGNRKSELNQRLWFVMQKAKKKDLISDFRIPLNCDEIERNKVYFLNIFNEIKEIKKQVISSNQLTFDTKDSKSSVSEIIYSGDKEQQDNINNKLNEYFYNHEKEKKTDLKTVKNFVNEFYFSDKESTFFDDIKELFRQRRKLKPNIKKIKKVYVSEKDTSVKLIMNLRRGSNVPIRKINNQTKTGQNAPLNPINLISKTEETNSFLQLQFENTNLTIKPGEAELSQINNNKQFNSEIIEGSDPNWHYYSEHQIELVYKEGYEGLGYIDLNLFDYFPNTHQKIITNKVTYFLEKRYLGSLRLPLKPLLNTGRISGVFNVKTPFLIFGYASKNPEDNSKQNKDNAIYEQLFDPFTPTNIDLRLNIEPILNINKKNYLHTQFANNNLINFRMGYEDSETIQKVTTWLKGFDRANKLDKILFADNLSGQSVLLFRYLNNEADNAMIHETFDIEDREISVKLARYVSLIPGIKNDYYDKVRVLKSNQEVLYSKSGSREEKAILLTNFFMEVAKNKQGKENLIVNNIIPTGQQNNQNNSIIDVNRNEPGKRQDTKAGEEIPTRIFLIYGYDALKNITVMVGKKEGEGLEIWDPNTAECFQVEIREFKSSFLGFIPIKHGNKNIFKGGNSIFTNLREVFQVVTHDDIIVYKGVNRELTNLDWNFDNKKQWESLKQYMIRNEPKTDKKDLLITKDLLTRLYSFSDSIQSDTLIYSEIKYDRIQYYEQELKLFLSRKIERERISAKKIELTEQFHNPYQTKWNTTLSEKIKLNLLTFIENFKLTMQTNAGHIEEQEEHVYRSLTELREIQEEIVSSVSESQEIYGFPLQFNLIEFESIWEEIKKTRFYDVYNNEVEFLLSVAVFPYANMFGAVWVFLGYIYELDEF